ncbi:MAG: hypothetical protein HY791_32950 [Deltaproteobacteria bacterium]|nr:hypothetical protein [Deltaproteobacteria bacterium]
MDFKRSIRADLPRTLALASSAYVINFGYEIARPAAESLFLSAHGSRSLPWVWLAVAVTVTIVVGVYQRLAARLDLGLLFGICSAITAGAFALMLALVGLGVPASVFVLYVLKDVYIVVLIEAFWSLSNVVHRLSAARWVYGLYMLLGSLGGASAGWLVGPIARRYGTLRALWILVPLYAAFSLYVLFVLRRFAPKEAVRRESSASWDEGIAALRASKYLGAMFLMVATAQVATTLIDYAYNTTLEATYSDTDARTAIGGQVYSAIELGAALLQLLAGPVLKLLGAPITVLTIPILMSLPIGLFAVTPGLAAVAVAKAAGKIFDYSIFRAAKELFYIPLDYTEKTRGKAIIDIFGYRVAKGATSLVVLGLMARELGEVVGFVVLGLLGVWLVLALRIGRGFRTLVSRKAEVG